MGNAIATLGMQGMTVLVIVLSVVIIIMGVVIIALSMQINKMIKDSVQQERNYQRKADVIRESLDDCKAQMRELERQKQAAEEDAKNYKAQRDFLMSSKKGTTQKPEEDAKVE